MRGFAALSLAFTLAGCGQDRAQHAPEPAVSATGSAAPAPAAPATFRPVVGRAILDADGLALGRSTANARHFGFGADRREVEAAADSALGPADDRSANGECGAGPMEFTTYPGLTLNFQGGKLVGWLAKESAHVVTSDGIRAGALMRDLEVTRSSRFVEGSTLEGEFEYLAADGQTIGGISAGAGRDAKVESLYAGVNCFFR